jgi:hypothetical protein
MSKTLTKLPTLSKLAVSEFKQMKTPKSLVLGCTVSTETPPFRGGTQELADSLLLMYKSCNGLRTSYMLTQLGVDTLTALRAA